MAISEICKFEVKSEIDEYVKDGMSRNQAAKKVAEIFAEALGRKISLDTIRTKDKRARAEVGSNEPTNSKTQSPPVLIESPRLTSSGGKREGAGRPTGPRMVTEAMQFAEIAISQLTRIRKDDPMRHGAYEKVVQWIEQQK